MNTQQIMELLLARMNTTTKDNQDGLFARMEDKIGANKEADQEETKAERKAFQEEMMKAYREKADANRAHLQEMMKKMKDEIKEDMKANSKPDLEGLKKIMEEMMNANQAKTEANLKEMRENIKSGQAEVRSIVNAWMANLKDDRKKEMSCQVTTEEYLDSKELNPEDMKS
jgi:hypothetical protein